MRHPVQKIKAQLLNILVTLFCAIRATTAHSLLVIVDILLERTRMLLLKFFTGATSWALFLFHITLRISSSLIEHLIINSL